MDSVEVSDTSANVVANLGALETLAGQNKLTSVTLTTPQTAMSMDVTRLQDAAGTATFGSAVAGPHGALYDC